MVCVCGVFVCDVVCVQCQVNRGASGAKAPGPPKAGAHLAAIINIFFLNNYCIARASFNDAMSSAT